MRTMRFVSGSLLLQTGPQSFIHFNITAGPSPESPPTLNASILGIPPKTQDHVRRIAEVVLQHLKALEQADIEPPRIIIPGPPQTIPKKWE